jgi:NET1-associated nuclear protein 1 (U3 small nucleolar RNA-associated protein 17)
LPRMYEGLASTVAFDRSSGIAALCTENYCVQLYNLLNDRGISEVRIWLQYILKKLYATFSCL